MGDVVGLEDDSVVGVSPPSLGREVVVVGSNEGILLTTGDIVGSDFIEEEDGSNVLGFNVTGDIVGVDVAGLDV